MIKSTRFSVSVLLGLLVLAACSMKDGAEPTPWFTESDAEALRLSEEDIAILSAQSKAFTQGGPEVEWIYPQLSSEVGTKHGLRVEFKSPSRLSIEFRKTQAPINFDSLDVRGRKFGLTKSIIEQVRPWTDIGSQYFVNHR